MGVGVRGLQQHSELVTIRSAFNKSGRAPGSGVCTEDDMAIKIAPVDLKLHNVQGKCTEGALGCCLP